MVDFCPFVLINTFDQIRDRFEHLEPLEGPVDLHALLRPIVVVTIIVKFTDGFVPLL